MIQLCELLYRHPYPNVTEYIGCQVTQGRVTSLVFAECKKTLMETVLVYLHFHHRNIMIKPDGTPVIVNFDDCKHITVSEEEEEKKKQQQRRRITNIITEQFGTHSKAEIWTT